MQVVYSRCCGLDVHQKCVVACVLLRDPDGTLHREVHSFGAMTADLLALNDWLNMQRVQQVAMESTGVYWSVLECTGSRFSTCWRPTMTSSW